MTLLDAEAPPPPSPWPVRVAAVAAILALSGAVLYWEFRFYPEKRQVERFMEALQAGDYRAAYQLWKPAATYAYADFLEDWGETTPSGRVRSYEIVSVEEGGAELLLVPGQGGQRRTVRVGGSSSGVIVSVRINGQAEPIRLWVEKKDHSLSFPPF